MHDNLCEAALADVHRLHCAERSLKFAMHLFERKGTHHKCAGTKRYGLHRRIDCGVEGSPEDVDVVGM
jgi:hypothetical protein